MTPAEGNRDGVWAAKCWRAFRGSWKPPVRPELFNFEDGLPGTLQGMRPLVTATQGTDGRLWFTGTDGIAWPEPKRIVRNSLAPPVWVESIEIDVHRQKA